MTGLSSRIVLGGQVNQRADERGSNEVRDQIRKFDSNVEPSLAAATK